MNRKLYIDDVNYDFKYFNITENRIETPINYFQPYLQMMRPTIKINIDIKIFGKVYTKYLHVDYYDFDKHCRVYIIDMQILTITDPIDGYCDIIGNCDRYGIDTEYYTIDQERIEKLKRILDEEDN